MPCFSKRVIILIPIILIFLMVIPCSADGELDLNGYLSPGNVLSPGDTASVVYCIDYDFDTSEESLQLYTGLLNPKWQLSIVIDGIYHDQPSSTGRYVNLGGFELFYDRSHSSQIELTLTGTVPEVASTGNYSVIRATWYDYAGDVIDEKTVSAVIVDPSEIDSIQKTREGELAALKNFLDGKKALGVDTTAAIDKYNLAAAAIESANGADSATASTLLSSAKSSIDESYSLIYKAWAGFSIEQAESSVYVVEEMITGYENKGFSDDSRVWVIRSYNDNAETLIVLAKDKNGLSDYDSARDYAEQALSKAEQAYSYAVSLNEELDIISPTMPVTPKTTTVSATSTSSSGLSTDFDELIPDLESDSNIEGLLHSEVDIESAIEILSMIGEGLMGAFEFLSDLISVASDN